VVGREGGEVREILTGTMARYAASGHVVYATADGTLMAAPFDLKRLEVTGPSVGLLEGVEVKFNSASQFTLSETGTLLYKTGAAGQRELVWVSRAGVVEPVDPAWQGGFLFPALSPDGTRLAVTVQDSESQDVWVKQLDRGPSLKLTFEGGRNDYPTWTPDGRSVTFFSDRAGGWDLWTKRADGSGEAVLELDRERGVPEARWSPDRQWLVYRTSVLDPGAGDILALRPGQDTEPVALVATEFHEGQPALSPDGSWMAYTSNETGRDEVYVVPFPNVGEGKWVVSNGGGTEPLWSRSGRELFYRNGQGDMVGVQVETEPTFSAGQSSVLFSATEFRSSPARPQYDVTPDSERFIMISQLGGDVAGELLLVQNFFEELKRLVPN
jgi:serine/threonine-protein kinase